jgi:hypothetical protein
VKLSALRVGGAAAVPQADVRPVADAGHSLLVDAGPELAHEIGRWLRAAL